MRQSNFLQVSSFWNSARKNEFAHFKQATGSLLLLAALAAIVACITFFQSTNGNVEHGYNNVPTTPYIL